MARLEGFSQCPGCGYDFATGEGERSCAWGDCPNLPAELDVFCPQCRFNFLMMEGNPPCADPLTCEHSVEPMSHVENMRRWREGRAPPPPAADRRCSTQRPDEPKGLASCVGSMRGGSFAGTRCRVDGLKVRCQFVMDPDAARVASVQLGVMVEVGITLSIHSAAA